MRKVWRDIADIDSQDCNHILTTYQSCFAYPLLHLKAGSCAHVQSGGDLCCRLT